MGAIAESIVAYAQPLLDETDGSIESMNEAFAISQVCWNIALLPKEEQDAALSKLRLTLKMEHDEFAEYRRSVLEPMIQRHKEMFPFLHRRLSTEDWPSDDLPSLEYPRKRPTEKYPGTEPYAPCPCQSGRKYKFCCRTAAR